MFFFPPTIPDWIASSLGTQRRRERITERRFYSTKSIFATISSRAANRSRPPRCARKIVVVKAHTRTHTHTLNVVVRFLWPTLSFRNENIFMFSLGKTNNDHNNKSIAFPQRPCRRRIGTHESTKHGKISAAHARNTVVIFSTAARLK